MRIPGVKNLAEIKYKVIYEYRYITQCLSIGYSESSYLPWAVGIDGRTHPFETLEEAVTYCVHRGVINPNDVDELTTCILNRCKAKYLDRAPFLS